MKGLLTAIIWWSMLELLFFSLSSYRTAEAKFPNTFPYRDECMGVDEPVCRDRPEKGKCKFFKDQYPWCFDRNYAAIQPNQKASVGASTLFFTFLSGVHLSEGTHQKIFYNYNVDECARECLRSASLCPFNIRCLSFEFYPFEDPKKSAPWNESGDRGVCILNNENRNSARLRNSDLG